MTSSNAPNTTGGPAPSLFAGKNKIMAVIGDEVSLIISIFIFLFFIILNRIQ